MFCGVCRFSHIVIPRNAVPLLMPLSCANEQRVQLTPTEGTSDKGRHLVGRKGVAPFDFVEEV
jgi:hypothetical protein